MTKSHHKGGNTKNLTHNQQSPDYKNYYNTRHYNTGHYNTGHSRTFATKRPDADMQIYITDEVKQKLDLYIEHCSTEISGLGRIAHSGSRYLIHDIYLFKQECTGSSSDLDEEDISNFLQECMMTGVDTGEIKLWWHSHADFDVFWSKTDDDTVETFKQAGWMISIVGNKKKEYRVRFDLFEPQRVCLDGLPLKVYRPADQNLVQQIKKEIEEKVTRVQYSGKYGEFSGGFPDLADWWDEDEDEGFRAKPSAYELADHYNAQQADQARQQEGGNNTKRVRVQIQGNQE